jgi:hypothetical protein
MEKIRLMRYLLSRGETVRFSLKLLKMGGSTYKKYREQIWQGLTTPWQRQAYQYIQQKQPQGQPTEQQRVNADPSQIARYVDPKKLAKLIAPPKRKPKIKPPRKPRRKTRKPTTS